MSELIKIEISDIKKGEWQWLDLLSPTSITILRSLATILSDMDTDAALIDEDELEL